MSTVVGNFDMFDEGSAGAAHLGAVPPEPRGEIADVSVVIPTYRRPALLARCLDAVLAQALAPARYEIIVCDDGPDDATRACVEDLARVHAQHGPCIRYLPVTSTQGPAGARNAGWRAARAPRIAFTDDDTLPDTNWLSAGLRALGAGANAVSGRIVVPLRDRPTDYETDAAGLARAEFATANAFVERAALERVGGFDERFTSAWREDSDLQFALMQAGYRIDRAADAVVLHPVRPARWGVSISQQKKSQFDALLYKKYPRLFRQRLRSMPPLLYYAIIAAAAICLYALGNGRTGVASIAALGWLALTAWFCAKRLATTARTLSHVLEMAYTSVLIPFLSVFWRLYGAVKFRTLFL
ncbi:glycosyltransferase family 2 protein [Caballeronia glathei]|jgi:GT2 family glycosyltransferase|uniref:Glycosyl transferase family 2 n=1 Tax=Caballeronia glathei TaxID=60547 RepID=A0A069PCT6_9BURK|nr:glycosyltransferase family A protein [Caballeronia glathei]KDR38327.1 glycosyl transferase family 2 [Caballeronia glathei]